MSRSGAESAEGRVHGARAVPANVEKELEKVHLEIETEVPLEVHDNKEALDVFLFSAKRINLYDTCFIPRKTVEVYNKKSS